MEIVNKRDKDRDENGSYKVMYLLAWQTGSYHIIIIASYNLLYIKHNDPSHCLQFQTNLTLPSLSITFIPHHPTPHHLFLSIP
jgi:hypothetical protein